MEEQLNDLKNLTTYYAFKKALKLQVQKQSDQPGAQIS